MSELLSRSVCLLQPTVLLFCKWLHTTGPGIPNERNRIFNNNNSDLLRIVRKGKVRTSADNVEKEEHNLTINLSSSTSKFVLNGQRNVSARQRMGKTGMRRLSRSFLLAPLSNASLDHDPSSLLWSPLSLCLNTSAERSFNGVVSRGNLCGRSRRAVLQGKEHGKALGIIGRLFPFPCRPGPWLHESAASRVSWRSPTSCKSPALTVLFLCGVRRSDPMEKEERKVVRASGRAGPNESNLSEGATRWGEREREEEVRERKRINLRKIRSPRSSFLPCCT